MTTGNLGSKAYSGGALDAGNIGSKALSGEAADIELGDLPINSGRLRLRLCYCWSIPDACGCVVAGETSGSPVPQHCFKEPLKSLSCSRCRASRTLMSSNLVLTGMPQCTESACMASLSATASSSLLWNIWFSGVVACRSRRRRPLIVINRQAQARLACLGT